MVEFRKLQGDKIDGGLVRKTAGKRRSLTWVSRKGVGLGEIKGRGSFLCNMDGRGTEIYKDENREVWCWWELTTNFSWEFWVLKTSSTWIYFQEFLAKWTKQVFFIDLQLRLLTFSNTIWTDSDSLRVT